MGHRQQHRQPVGLQADAQAARIGERALVDQRLHLHQQRAGAFLSRQHHAAGAGRALAADEHRRRIGDILQALLGHRKHADFVDRAEAVFERANQTECARAVALKIQYAVDDVLENARTGERAFFGYMPDQQRRAAALLGVSHQPRGALAHLRHAPRRLGHRLAIQRLNGVRHQHRRRFTPRGVEQRLQPILRHHFELPAAQFQPARAQCQLLGGFLAADIQRRAGSADGGETLQQQSGFADAGVAAEQHGRAAYQPAAQHAVEFGAAAGQPADFGHIHLRELARFGAWRKPAESARR